MEDRREELKLSKTQTINLKVYAGIRTVSPCTLPVPGCWHWSPTWSQWILVQLQLVPASHEFIFLYLSFDLIFLIFNPDVPNISFLIYQPHSHRKGITKNVRICRMLEVSV